MPRLPKLKRHITIVAHDPDRIELRSGVWNVTSFELNDEKKTGKLFQLLSGLDGSISAADLAEREGVLRSDVESLIDHLLQLELIDFGAESALDHYIDQVVSPLTRAGSEREAPRETLLLGGEESCRLVADLLQQALPDATVTIGDSTDPLLKPIFDPDIQWLYDGLAFQEQVQKLDSLKDKLVVHVDDTLHPTRLSVLNRLSLALGFAWLQGALDGPQVLVGPLFEPNQTPCFECLETRVLMNLREHMIYVSYRNRLVEGTIKLGDPPINPVLRSTLASHLSMETLNTLLTGTTFTRSKLFTIYLPTMETMFNDILRVPGCPACSPPSEESEPELYFDLRALIEGGSDV